MKELLTAIIGKEEELKGRSDKTEKEAQTLLEAAKTKAEGIASDYETNFREEKERKTREVEEAVKKYDDGLKSRLSADLKESRKKLDGRKEQIKADILKAMLEE